MKLLFTAVLLFCGSQMSAQALTMSFGKTNRIVYSLQTGNYDVVFDGHVKMKGIGSSSYIKYKKTTITGGVLYTIERKGLEQLFYVFAGKPYFFVQVKLKDSMNQISSLKASVEHKQGLVVPFDNDMWVQYEIKPGNYVSSEVTAFPEEGLVIGSIEHSVWKTGIRVDDDGLEVFAGYTDSVGTHDVIGHGRAAGIGPKIMVGCFKDWRNGMEQYAQCNKLAEPPVIRPWKKATPMGWNSWGVLQTKLNLQNAKAVVDFFKDSCQGFRNEDGVLYIDLDSYWDNMKDAQLKEFVLYCKTRGFIPGIYWGPFADWGKQDRNIEGSIHSYGDTWIKQHGRPVNLDGAFAMDPTHPGTKDRIKHYTGRFKALGFEMIKIDFLGHAALESEQFYNPRVRTGMQAFAEGMQLLDSMIDGSMLVYAAISPTMATGRYVHMRRIACDAFSAIDNTEYTLNSTGYGWWQAWMYQYVDADHVVFGKEKEGANRARMASALVTGTLITGDDFSTGGAWTEAAKKLLQNKALLSIIQDGKPFRPLRINEGKKAPEVFIKTVKGKTWLAVFNYDNSPKKFNLKELANSQPARELFTQTTPASTIEIPPADARIYEIGQ